MRVNIKKKLQVFLLGKFYLHVRLYQFHFRARLRVEIIAILVGEEVPVHVFALQISAVIAQDDTVWVHHGEDPPLEFLAEFLCVF